MNHAPSAGSIAQNVDLQSNALCHGCPLNVGACYFSGLMLLEVLVRVAVAFCDRVGGIRGTVVVHWSIGQQVN